MELENQAVKKFQEQEAKLFEPTSPRPPKMNLSKVADPHKIFEFGAFLTRQCVIRPGFGTKLIKISNVLCFARVAVNKQKAECTVSLLTKLDCQKLEYLFT